MWVTVAIAIEQECPLDEAHTCEIVRLGKQTEEYMREELSKELGSMRGSRLWVIQDLIDLSALFQVFISVHKLPPIAVTVVTWHDIMDGAKLTDPPTVSRVLYGHGVTDEDKEWQRIVDDEYDEIMAEVPDNEKLTKEQYLEQEQNAAMCTVTETTVTDK